MSFEETLARKTPTEECINKIANNANYNELKKKARIEVDHFKKLCEEQASKGNRSCFCYTYAWLNHTLDGNDFYGEDYYYVAGRGNLAQNGMIPSKDFNTFIQLLKQELKNEGFENAKITMSPIKKTRTTYSRHRRIFSVKVKEHSRIEIVAEQIQISTSW